MANNLHPAHDAGVLKLKAHLRQLGYVATVGIPHCYRHRTLLMRMTSLLLLPRVSASCLASGDQEKSKIMPD
jgi:hypothetical protein